MQQTTVFRSRQHNRVSLVAFGVLLVSCLIGLALWRVPGIQVMSVESASMSPAIRRGDAVMLRTVQADDLRVGDVVSYRSPADQRVIITHRIVAVEKNWNLLITKGDNVQKNDKPIATSEIIGRVDMKVAYLGFVLNFLRTPAGLASCIYLPAAAIIASELRRLARYYTKPTYRLLAYARH
jgi:signal peptidase